MRLNRITGAVPSVALVVVSTYLALLAVETGLWWRGRTVSRILLERGMYRPDSTLGVALTPGYTTSFDDGPAKGRISINSLGHRDDEPQPGDDQSRVLLVGDSFTFGALLDQHDTIDHALERRHPGLDAYNLGVSGYDLPNQVDALRRCQLPARHVVYLFFGNDIQVPLEQTVWNGYRVTHAPSSAPGDSNDRDWEPRIAALEAARNRRVPPLRTLLIPGFRDLLRSAFHRVAANNAQPDDTFAPEQRTALVARGLRFTAEMRDVAEARHMGFQVAIVPAREEVLARSYSKSDADYIAGLRSIGIEPIEMLSALRGSDYWAHNLHFNSSGARIAADAIAQALPPSVTHR